MKLQNPIDQDLEKNNSSLSLKEIEDFENWFEQLFVFLRSSRLSGEDYFVILYLLFAQIGKIKLIVTENDGNSDIRVTLEEKNGYFILPNKNQETIIHETFVPILEKLGKYSLNELTFILTKIDKNVLKENFSEIFERLLYRLSKFQGRFSGEIIMPLEFSRFMCSLSELPPNSKIYNPFAGLASFSIFLDESQDYLGQEISSKTWAIGVLRIIANDRIGKSKLLLSDSLTDWNPTSIYKHSKLEDFFKNLPEKEKFDLIISNPPFGLRFHNQFESRFGQVRSAEYFLIENGLDALSANGKMILCVPVGFLFSNRISDQNFRSYIVTNDLLEMVVLMPGGMFMNTSATTAIIVINKFKKNIGKVSFVDANSFIENTSPREKKLNDHKLYETIKEATNIEIIRTVPNESIINNDFNLNVPRYFQNELDGVKLGDIGSVYRGNRVNEGQIGKFVRIRNLKDDKLDFQLLIDEIDEVVLPRHAQCIEESCILMALRWKTLKPTYFNYTGIPVFVNSDILAFKVNESKVDSAFLINELHSLYVTEQLDSFKTGTLIPMIKREDLFSVMILLPEEGEQGLAKQKLIVKEQLIKLAEEKKKDLNWFNKIHGLETEIVEQNTYLRHTLAGPSSNLKDSIANVKKIILEKIAQNQPSVLDYKLSENHLISLGEYLSIIERDVEKIVIAVSRQLKIDSGIEDKKLFPIEIFDFLKKYSSEYNEREGLNFKILFEFDKEVFFDLDGNLIKSFILANEEMLHDLFDNLINNAVKHAFSADTNNRIEIYLMKNLSNDDQDDIQILFSNTGKPFPENFTLKDFVRKGFKYGLNAGDGFGGWYVNEIIKKLKGNFDIIDETGSEGLPDTDLATSFEINFPLIETEENV